ncbi:uncharacterized protein EI97DRAFT_443385 [Westerdykella ornata]|uniref:Uncharacterized protein n=1 Tax=Westerdykella ornata TaxID=318751 RepID=A0A6A6JFT5_WESOR|nr:uncharacterized protein EI97DRAFT_443385 [Westerdykella ornata]KAF2275135.1 hypothetical protein EI97DRAFT_443385 [Westerdykella ornata]
MAEVVAQKRRCCAGSVAGCRGNGAQTAARSPSAAMAEEEASQRVSGFGAQQEKKKEKEKETLAMMGGDHGPRCPEQQCERNPNADSGRCSAGPVSYELWNGCQQRLQQAEELPSVGEGADAPRLAGVITSTAVAALKQTNGILVRVTTSSDSSRDGEERRSSHSKLNYSEASDERSKTPLCAALRLQQGNCPQRTSSKLTPTRPHGRYRRSQSYTPQGEWFGASAP